MYESSNSGKKGDAEKLLKLREGDIARGLPVTPQVNRVTLGELVEDVLNDYRINGKKTLKDTERRFNKHILPYFASSKLAASITASDVRKCIAR
jgi:hypothetical protein